MTYNFPLRRTILQPSQIRRTLDRTFIANNLQSTSPESQNFWGIEEYRVRGPLIQATSQQFLDQTVTQTESDLLCITFEQSGIIPHHQMAVNFLHQIQRNRHANQQTGPAVKTCDEQINIQC